MEIAEYWLLVGRQLFISFDAEHTIYGIDQCRIVITELGVLYPFVCFILNLQSIRFPGFNTKIIINMVNTCFFGFEEVLIDVTNFLNNNLFKP